MRNKTAATLLLVIALGLASPASAFYESEEEGEYLSIRASIRALGVATDNPDVPLLYKEKNDTLAGGMGRLEIDGAWGGWFAVQVNAYALGIYNSAGSGGASFVKLQSAQRSGALETGLFENDDSKAEVALDWANVTFTIGGADLKLGRQPVNLASTMYFTPNDFFAPFAADVFYRVYKAGVDAARLEMGVGHLSQLTLLAVAGYGPDPDTVNGYANTPDNELTSYVARVSTVAYDYEFAALGGKLRRQNVYGGSFQGTFFEWLGVRMEGHWAEPMDEGKEGRLELAIDLDRRFDSSLELRAAAFHHGAGVDDAMLYADRLLRADEMESPYLARWYAAVGGSYQFTPLLTGTALAIINTVDGSFTVSVNGVYSLSDEGEMFVGVSVPFGDKPEHMTIISEYGASPVAASVEARYFF